MYDVCQFPPAHQTKSTTLSTTSVTATQVMFGCSQGVFVVILLVQWVRDGMVLDVWQFHALQTPTTMALSVFVRILEINVYHGRCMMESDVYMYLDHVQQELHGTELTVQLIVVQQDFMVLEVTVQRYLSVVFHLQFGAMVVVVLVVHVLMEHIFRVEVVIPTCPVRMVKHGMIV